MHPAITPTILPPLFRRAAQRFHELLGRFALEKSRARFIIFQDSSQRSQTNQVIADQAPRNSNQKNQVRPPTLGKGNSGAAAANPKHNVLDQIGPGVRKDNAMLDHTWIGLFPGQHLLDKLFRIPDLFGRSERCHNPTNRFFGRSGAQVQSDILRVEQIGEGYRHERICWILVRKQLSS